MKAYPLFFLLGLASAGLSVSKHKTLQTNKNGGNTPLEKYKLDRNNLVPRRIRDTGRLNKYSATIEDNSPLVPLLETWFDLKLSIIVECFGPKEYRQHQTDLREKVEKTYSELQENAQMNTEIIKQIEEEHKEMLHFINDENICQEPSVEGRWKSYNYTIEEDSPVIPSLDAWVDLKGKILRECFFYNEFRKPPTDLRERVENSFSVLQNTSEMLQPGLRTVIEEEYKELMYHLNENPECRVSSKAGKDKRPLKRWQKGQETQRTNRYSATIEDNSPLLPLMETWFDLKLTVIVECFGPNEYRHHPTDLREKIEKTFSELQVKGQMNTEIMKHIEEEHKEMLHFIDDEKICQVSSKESRWKSYNYTIEEDSPVIPLLDAWVDLKGTVLRECFFYNEYRQPPTDLPERVENAFSGLQKNSGMFHPGLRTVIEEEYKELKYHLNENPECRASSKAVRLNKYSAAIEDNSQLIPLMEAWFNLKVTLIVECFGPKEYRHHPTDLREKVEKMYSELREKAPKNMEIITQLYEEHKEMLHFLDDESICQEPSKEGRWKSYGYTFEKESPVIPLLDAWIDIKGTVRMECFFPKEFRRPPTDLPERVENAFSGLQKTSEMLQPGLRKVIEEEYKELKFHLNENPECRVSSKAGRTNKYSATIEDNSPLAPLLETWFDLMVTVIVECFGPKEYRHHPTNLREKIEKTFSELQVKGQMNTEIMKYIEEEHKEMLHYVDDETICQESFIEGRRKSYNYTIEEDSSVIPLLDDWVVLKGTVLRECFFYNEYRQPPADLPERVENAFSGLQKNSETLHPGLRKLIEEEYKELKYHLNENPECRVSPKAVSSRLSVSRRDTLQTNKNGGNTPVENYKLDPNHLVPRRIRDTGSSLKRYAVNDDDIFELDTLLKTWVRLKEMIFNLASKGMLASALRGNVEIPFLELYQNWDKIEPEIARELEADYLKMMTIFDEDSKEYDNKAIDRFHHLSGILRLESSVVRDPLSAVETLLNSSIERNSSIASSVSTADSGSRTTLLSSLRMLRARKEIHTVKNLAFKNSSPRNNRLVKQPVMSNHPFAKDDRSKVKAVISGFLDSAADFTVEFMNAYFNEEHRNNENYNDEDYKMENNSDENYNNENSENESSENENFENHNDETTKNKNENSSDENYENHNDENSKNKNDNHNDENHKNENSENENHNDETTKNKNENYDDEKYENHNDEKSKNKNHNDENYKNENSENEDHNDETTKNKNEIHNDENNKNENSENEDDNDETTKKKNKNHNDENYKNENKNDENHNYENTKNKNHKNEDLNDENYKNKNHNGENYEKENHNDENTQNKNHNAENYQNKNHNDENYKNHNDENYKNHNEENHKKENHNDVNYKDKNLNDGNNKNENHKNKNHNEENNKTENRNDVNYKKKNLNDENNKNENHKNKNHNEEYHNDMNYKNKNLNDENNKNKNHNEENHKKANHNDENKKNKNLIDENDKNENQTNKNHNEENHNDENNKKKNLNDENNKNENHKVEHYKNESYNNETCKNKNSNKENHKNDKSNDENYKSEKNKDENYNNEHYSDENYNNEHYSDENSKNENSTIDNDNPTQEKSVRFMNKRIYRMIKKLPDGELRDRYLEVLKVLELERKRLKLEEI